jgi:hypothetical protein
MHQRIHKEAAKNKKDANIYDRLVSNFVQATKNPPKRVGAGV